MLCPVRGCTPRFLLGLHLGPIYRRVMDGLVQVLAIGEFCTCVFIQSWTWADTCIEINKIRQIQLFPVAKCSLYIQVHVHTGMYK